MPTFGSPEEIADWLREEDCHPEDDTVLPEGNTVQTD